MTTINAVDTTLSGQTGTGNFVGSASPTMSTPAANNFLEGYTTTATSGGTTTLTVSSNRQQFFTGTSTENLVLPVTSTLVLGQSYFVVNSSTQDVTVESSGGNTIAMMGPNTSASYFCILTSGTTAASWYTTYNNNSSAITTAWVAYTPTFVALGTVTNISIHSRRIGNSLEIFGGFTTGTTTGSTASMTLGYNGTDSNVNSSAIIISGTQGVGFCPSNVVGAASNWCIIGSNTDVMNFGYQNAGNSALTAASGNAIFGTGANVSINATIPVDTFPS